MPLIDIVRLDENPHETINGIRDDTASLGVDLEGATITATGVFLFSRSNYLCKVRVPGAPLVNNILAQVG